MGRNLQQDVTRGTVPLCQPETSTHQERSHFREHSQRGFFVIYRFQKVIQILFYLSDRVSRNRNVLTVVKGCLAQYIVRNTRRRRSSENREHLIHIRWAESTLPGAENHGMRNPLWGQVQLWCCPILQVPKVIRILRWLGQVFSALPFCHLARVASAAMRLQKIFQRR